MAVTVAIVLVASLLTDVSARSNWRRRRNASSRTMGDALNDLEQTLSGGSSTDSPRR